MIKTTIVVVFLTSSLFGQNFDEFLDNAIKNSPYLKASNLGIEQAKESGDTLTRYANPTLVLEATNFRLNDGSNDMGYRANYSQPIRLWGIGDAKENLSIAMNNSAKSLYSLKKARFTRDISLLYTIYANQKRVLNLGYEELLIAKSIYNISKERNKAGTISQGETLQAQVDFEIVEVRINNLELTTQESYFNLLRGAGISQKIDLEYMHSFTLNQDFVNISNPDIEYLKKSKQKSLAEAEVNSNAIEWISLSAGYQTKPGRDVFRIATSIPLAFFNTKSQEKQISQIKAKKAQLLNKNEDSKLKMEILRLTTQRDLLLKLKAQNQITLKTQTKLLKMFKEGYKIASVNLLQLQSIKNNLMKTKKNIININSALDKNAINSNYIAGAYND